MPIERKVESWLEHILDVLQDDVRALLKQELLIRNSFQDMYWEDLESIIDSDLFQDSNYITFENKDIRLLFLNLYLLDIKDNWEYISFVDYIKKREQGHLCQKYANDAKISLALKLPDLIQGDRILRETV